MGCESSAVDLQNATICERIKMLFRCNNCSTCCNETVDVIVKVDSSNNIQEIINELKHKDSVKDIKIL